MALCGTTDAQTLATMHIVAVDAVAAAATESMCPSAAEMLAVF